MQVGYLVVAIPVVALFQLLLTRHVVPCKERKVVVTPWHVTSMGARHARAPPPKKKTHSGVGR